MKDRPSRPFCQRRAIAMIAAAGLLAMPAFAATSGSESLAPGGGKECFYHAHLWHDRGLQRYDEQGHGDGDHRRPPERSARAGTLHGGQGRQHRSC